MDSSVLAPPASTMTPPLQAPPPSTVIACPRMRRRCRGTLVAALLLGALAACGKSGGSEEPAEEPPVNPDAPADLAYADPVVLGLAGVAIEVRTPTVTGEGITFTATPALPSWLALDANTGALSGTPPELSTATLHEIVATNSFGSTQTTVSVRVTGFPRFALTANAGDDTVSVHTVAAASGELTHRGYLAQSASEGSPHQVVVDPLQRFAFTASDFAVTPYRVDPVSGVVTAGTPAAVGTGPHSLFVHPSGSWLYVSSYGPDRLRAYAIDPSTGALTQVDQETVGDGPVSVSGDPGGRFLVVAHDPGAELLSFVIDPETGALEPSSTLAVSGVEVLSGVVDPLGESYYALLTSPFDGVVRYSVEDGATGELKARTAVTTGSDPVSISIAPDGHHLYLLNRGSATIAVFTVEAGTGKLIDEVQIASTTGTSSLDFGGTGGFAYACDSTAGRIVVYAVDAESGELSAREEVRARPGVTDLDLLHGALPVDRRTGHLYVANGGSGDVTHYTVDEATGALDDGGALAALAGDAPSDVALDPLGRFAFVPCAGSHEIVVFAIDGAGELTDNLTTFSVTNGAPAAAVVDPSGRFLYVTLPAWHFVLRLVVDAEGVLHDPDTRPVGTHPEAVAVDPTGRFLYVVDRGDQVTTFGEVSVFSIDPSTGSLAAAGTGEAPGGPTGLTFAPGGERAYATASESGLVRPYDVGTDGALAFVEPGTAALVEPYDIAISPDGLFAFVAVLDSASTGSVLVFDVNPDTGALYDSTSGAPTWRTQVFAGTGPRDVEASADGAFLWVLSGTSERVDVFAFDAETAGLSPVETEPTGLAPVRMKGSLVVE